MNHSNDSFNSIYTSRATHLMASPQITRTTNNYSSNSRAVQGHSAANQQLSRLNTDLDAPSDADSENTAVDSAQTPRIKIKGYDSENESPLPYSAMSTPMRTLQNSTKTPLSAATPFVKQGMMEMPMYDATTTPVPFSLSTVKLESNPFDNESIASGDMETKQLCKVLNAHQIAAITLSSVFGTGLLIKSAATLHTCGPLPLLMGYSFIALLSYQVVSSLCEMCTYIPLPNAYSGYTERFVDPALGYTLGYFYLIMYLILGPNQIFVGGMTMQYWVPESRVNPAVWITIFIVLLSLLNYIDVGKIATLADVFVLFKIVVYFTITCILLSIVCGGNKDHEAIGFRYWSNPGAVNLKPYESLARSKAAGGIVSFIEGICESVFPFVGVESFCVTVSEAYYPRRTIPKAKNVLFFFLVTAYIPLVFFIGLAVSYNDANFSDVIENQSKTTVAGSAIFLAFQNAGLKMLPNILNGFIFVFVLSAANGSFYISTRILYGLSACGLAPAIFSKTSNGGVPLAALLLVSCFNVLGYVGVTESSRNLFEIFSSSISGFALILWFCILLTHVCYLNAREAQQADNSSITYRAKGGKIASIVAMIFCAILIVGRDFSAFLDMDHFNYKSIITSYICIPVFVLTYFAFKFYYKTSIIKPHEADLYFYKDCVDATETEYINNEIKKYSNKEQENPVKRVYKRLLV